MSEKINFDGAVSSLFDGMNKFMSTKTVVGEAIHIEDTIILPLVDVSFGMGAGTKGDGTKATASGGMGAKMSPTAVLVIHNGSSKIISVKNQDGVSKILDMVPDIINKITKKKDNELTDEEILNAAQEQTEEK
ncbi:MAG: GerW family sporulation protein [Lachnospiraceae bacterium]|nr:GerW family sporulation protein [Lachnospiraceae bacterium]